MASENWVRVSRGNPCPVCEGTDKCAVSRNGDVCRCSRKEFFAGTKAFSYSDVPFATWTHRLRPETAPSHRGSNQSKPDLPRPEREPVPTLDPVEVYSRFLSLSPADKDNREDCQKRGLDPDALGYGSFPAAKGRIAIISALVERFGPGLLSVPGFLESKPGRIDFAHKGFVKPALLVPCRNRFGDPVCLRMRNPSPGATKNKWTYLSGGKHYDDTNGASARPSVHWARLPKPGQPILLTEGERKADTIAARLPDLGVVSVPGAATWRISGLVEDLEALEATMVRIAYDSDLWENKDVARGFLSLFAALEEKGVGVEVAIWDKAHKGLDDALMAGASIIVRKTDEAQAFRLELAKRHTMQPDGLPGVSTPDEPPRRPIVHLDWDPVTITTRAMESIAGDERLFMREGKLVALGGVDFSADPTGKIHKTKQAIFPVCNNLLSTYLDDLVCWVKEHKDGIKPAACPLFVASKILARIGKDDGPIPRPIFGITQGPTLTLSGELINANGYHQIGGLGWWQENAVEGIETRLTEPGSDPREFAYDQIEQLRQVGFPYIEWADRQEDWARFLCFLFALILRPSIEKIPFHLICGNAPGSGKGILASAAHRIAYGSLMNSMTWPERQDTRDEILAKEIVNAIEAGAAVFYFDDIPQGTAIASKELDKAIGGQGEGVTARQMMQNSGRSVGGKARMAFFGCGNNVSANEDFGRRCVTIRIETRTPDPATRDPRISFAGQGDLTRWFSQAGNREKCLVFALNALRAYLVYLDKGGKEMAGKTLGGFYDYAKFCAGAVIFATGVDPLEKMADEIRSTESAGGLAGLVSALDREGLLTQDGRKSSLIKEMIGKIEDPEIKEDITSLFFSCGHRGKELTARGIGKVLGVHKNKPIWINGTTYKIIAENDRIGFSNYSLSKTQIGAGQ